MLEELRNMVMNELDGIISKGKFDNNSLACTYNLVDILKDIEEIEEKEGGYSNAGRYNMNSYRGMGGNSYARNSYRNNGGGYSRDGEVMDKLNRMMNEASSEHEREIIRKVMNNM